MKEKLIDIAKVLKSCSNAIQGKRIYPIARVHCNYDGDEKSFWFTNTSTLVSSLKYPEVAKFGSFVPKNSDIAIQMQTRDVGETLEYKQPDLIKRLRNHRVVIENRSDLQNKTIAIAGDPLLYQYRNINEFLIALQKNKDDISEIENKISDLRKLISTLKSQQGTAQKRAQITKSINALQKEYRILTQQQEDLKNITIYIRKQDEMRYSLIVDTIQTRIKTQNLFDGKTIIINGGPGTGKSTTMIHRLAYLTDIYAIDEDEKKRLFNYKLNPTQRRQLLDTIKSNRDWMFFSPSPILRDYLATAMKKEGLDNTNQKVWNWKDFSRMVMRVNYGLLGGETNKAPFRISYFADTLFYQGYNIPNELMEFYLKQLRSIKSQLSKLEAGRTVYEWTAIAKSIKSRFQASETFSLGQFISLFNTLESVYSDDRKKIIKDKNETIKYLTTEIFALLKQNEDVNRNLEELLDLSSEDTVELSEEVVPEESDIESENTQDITKNKLYTQVESWLKSYCYNKVNPNALLSAEKQLISDILLPILDNRFNNQLTKIEEIMVFEQYAQYTRGVNSIMLAKILTIYKNFRTHLSRTQYKGCNLELLRDLMHRKHGQELHHQEVSLLLGFINTIVKQIKASNRPDNKHRYIEAYEELSRPIIGIDEATDFSICDIYAMQSLLTREYSSLTLCGDLMQRLTTSGIKSWSELYGVVPNLTEVELKTSYRQSKKLLEVARQIYNDTLGKTPNYKAFMKSNKVPEPLVFIDANEYMKIEWISKRIKEVYHAYGEQLPSIAIFVNDKGYIPGFIQRIKETEFFKKNSIGIINGSTDNSKTTEHHISVYPIEVVKGMEFDVVFFHNIDNFAADNSADTELLKRYIYVGVSRAAFFLGITLSEPNDEISKYFERGKDWFKI